MDLMGPTKVVSVRGKRYIFVFVDDYLHFTLVDFLKENRRPLKNTQLEDEKGKAVGRIIRIRTNYGKEFQN